MLKKEFKRKDVDRIRNLIKGNVGASSEVQIGYTKKTKDYKEGDVWVENRKTWTIKKGIKQTISKFDKIKKEVHIPLCCPECSQVMRKHLDKSCYKTNKKCVDCVVKFEHKITLEGNYEKYSKTKIINSNLARINDMEAYYLEKINQNNNSFVSEDGIIERWVGGVDKESLSDEIKTTAKKLRKKFNKELKNL
tara:strand:+ start:294 stop:872 length:579 start_codon:yes stop_codon:yes gene_type:complete